jgi:pimeloyl-ACP methyl ester carboxylesterase
MDIPVPSLRSVFLESLGLLELPRLALNFPQLTAETRGNGAPVLVLPGFGTSDASTALLRGYLRYLGYEVRGWGLGINDGNVRALVPRVIERASDFARGAGQRLRLVGWSLGGVLARETAREHPALVERIITLGTPVVGGPKYTAAAARYRQRGYDLDAIEAAVAARNRVPIRVPITAIYSRADGVVAWQACLDHHSPEVEHLEVRATHIGLGLSPEVYRIVAQRLALRDRPKRKTRRGVSAVPPRRQSRPAPTSSAARSTTPAR